MSGIDVTGNLTDGVTVTVWGRERIRAARDAAARHRPDDDVDLDMLRCAVGQDLDQVILDPIDDEEDASDLADLLDDVRNGDDPAPAQAAKALRTVSRRMVVCPKCDGEGEVEV